MSRPTSYRMCDLRNGATHLKTYIEERGAIVGKFVEVLDLDIEGRWEVLNVGDKSVSHEALVEIQKNEKNQRKASDI